MLCDTHSLRRTSLNHYIYNLQVAAAAGGELSSDSRVTASGFGSAYGAGMGSATGGAYGGGSGFGGGFGGGGSNLVMGIGGGNNTSSLGGGMLGGGGDNRASTPYDQDEQFEQLEANIALSQDPDSLPFFKASKLASARSHKNKGKPGIRSVDRPFQ